MASSSEEQEEVCKCLEKFILENHIGNSTRVILCGCQITAWTDEHGEEFLFFSRKALCCCHGSCGSGRGAETVSSGPKIEEEPQPETISSSTTEIVEELQLAPHAAPHPAPVPLPDPHAAPQPAPHLAIQLAPVHQMPRRIRHMLNHSGRPPQPAPHAALQLAPQAAPRPVHQFWLPMLNHMLQYIRLPMLHRIRLPMLHHSRLPNLPGPHAARQLAPHAAPTWTRFAKGILVGFSIGIYWFLGFLYEDTCFRKVRLNNVWLIPLAMSSSFLVYGQTVIQKIYQLGPIERSIFMLFTVLVSALTVADSILLGSHLDGAPGFWTVGFSQAIIISPRATIGEYTDCGFSKMINAIFFPRCKRKFTNSFGLIGVAYFYYLLRLGGTLITKRKKPSKTTRTYECILDPDEKQFRTSRKYIQGAGIGSRECCSACRNERRNGRI